MLLGRLLAESSSVSKQTMSFVNLSVNCYVAKPVHSAPGLSQKKELSPGLAGCYLKENKLKYVKSASCVTIALCKTCNKCQKCYLNSACRGQTSKLLANLAGSGCRSESGSNPERGLHPPLSDPAKTHKVSHSHKLLCQSPQEPLPAGGITSAYKQKCSGTSTKPNISGIFQLTIFSPKAQQQVETYIRSEQTESFPQGREIQSGDTGIRTSLQPGEWVTSIDFKDTYFHIPIQGQSRIYLRFHVQGQTYQFKPLPFGLSTAPLEFSVVAKEVKLTAIHKGIRIHQYLDNWLVRARSHQVCLQHTQDLVKICQE